MSSGLPASVSACTASSSPSSASQLRQEGHQVAAAAGVVHAHRFAGELARAAMLMSGVMPMPPATSTARGRPACTGKSFLGTSMSSAVAFLQALVHEARAAAALVLAAHRDAVLGRRVGDAGLRARVDQRVVAPVLLAVRQRDLHADVRAGGEAGQRRAVLGRQAERADQRVEAARLDDAQLQGGGCFVRAHGFLSPFVFSPVRTAPAWRAAACRARRPAPRRAARAGWRAPCAWPARSAASISSLVVAQAALMGVAVALDQALALRDLQRQRRVEGGSLARCGASHCSMRRVLLGEARGGPAPARRSGHAAQHQVAAQRAGAHHAALLRHALDQAARRARVHQPAADAAGQRLADFLQARVHVLVDRQQLVGLHAGLVAHALEAGGAGLERGDAGGVFVGHPQRQVARGFLAAAGRRRWPAAPRRLSCGPGRWRRRPGPGSRSGGARLPAASRGRLAGKFCCTRATSAPHLRIARRGRGHAAAAASAAAGASPACARVEGAAEGRAGWA